MADQLDPEQAARLARLGQRRAPQAPAAPADEAPVIDKHTNVAVTRTKRRHAAAAGRVLATGLATSGFLGTITAMAQSDIHKDQNDAATPTPSSVVVKTIQRITYVDENGNPVAPPSSLPGGTVPGVVDSVPVVPTATTLVGTPLAPGTPVTTAPGTPVAPGTPTPVSTAPCSGLAVVATCVPIATLSPIANNTIPIARNTS